MEIKEFVETTLKQIAEAAVSASDKKTKFHLDPSTNGVHFDLAVTATSTELKTKEGKAGLQVKIVQAGGKVAAEKTDTTESVSRIGFNVIPEEIFSDEVEPDRYNVSFGIEA